MGAAGAEVVLNGLLVANVDEDMLEQAHVGGALHGDEESALHHVLQETHALEAYGLAAGVGTGDEQDALVGFQGDVERYHLFAVFLQGQVKQRMDGLLPLNARVVGDVGESSLYVDGKQCLGAQEVVAP